MGAGYGNMEIEEFTEIFCQLALPQSLKTFELIIHWEVFFRYACQRNEELGGPAQIA